MGLHLYYWTVSPFRGLLFFIDELVFSGTVCSSSVGRVVFSGHKAIGSCALSGTALVLCSLLQASIHTGLGHSSEAGPVLVINEMNYVLRGYFQVGFGL